MVITVTIKHISRGTPRLKTTANQLAVVFSYSENLLSLKLAVRGALRSWNAVGPTLNSSKPADFKARPCPKLGVNRPAKDNDTG